MAITVTPCWTAPDGTRTAADRYPPARSDAEVWSLVIRGFTEARRARGTDIVVLVGDDTLWVTHYRITGA